MQASENYLDAGEIGGLYVKKIASKNLPTSPPSENARPLSPGPTPPAATSSPRFHQSQNHHTNHHHPTSFEQIFGRVVENVKPSPMTCALDDENRGYDLYGFGSGSASTSMSNNSSSSSLSSTSALSILDDSTSTIHAENNSTSSVDDGLQLTPTRPLVNGRRLWSKNNCLTKTLGQKQPFSNNYHQNCCEDCDLCFLTCSWPSSPSTAPSQQQMQPLYAGNGVRLVEFRPIINCCKCTPCQCTFENNYCGCHTLGAGPCC